MGSKSYSLVDETNQQIQPMGDLEQSNLLTIGGDENTVTLTDQGALAVAGDIAESAYDIISKSLDNISESNEIQAQTTRQAIDRGLALAESTIDETTKDTTEKFLTFGMVAAGVFAAITIFKRKK